MEDSTCPREPLFLLPKPTPPAVFSIPLMATPWGQLLRSNESHSFLFLPHPICNLSGIPVGSALKIHPAPGHFSPPPLLWLCSGTLSSVTGTAATVSHRSPCFCPYPQRSIGSTAARVTLLRHRAELATHLLEILQWLPSHTGVKARKVWQMDHSPIYGLMPFPLSLTHSASLPSLNVTAP